MKEEFKESLDIKYLFYCCFNLDEYCRECLNQGNFASVDMKKLGKFNFKVISLAEQKKIVNVLDRFDKICNNLAEGLPAEIEARNKQYEYYRNKLLNFEELQK